MKPLEVGRVIMFAKDMGVMLRFYEEVLGLERHPGADDTAEFVSLAAGGIDIALHAVPAEYADDIEIDDPPEPRRDCAAKIAFRTDGMSGGTPGSPIPVGTLPV